MTINNNNIFGVFTLNEARGSRLTGDWLNKEFVANYGWFGGGATPASVATVDRIDFSNDSATASPRGSLSSARYSAAATGNSNYGWFGGGWLPGATATVDRIDFSNDSTTASPRGPLFVARTNLAATGNSNYGWFGGGATPTTVFSSIDRIDFSNDSAGASVRGSLSSPERYGLAATGNSNYGWFGGGRIPAAISLVDRIDFSNDSSTLSVRGPLRLARAYLAATGNSNYGWFGGGYTSPSSYSIIDRIDFSNDSVALSVRGPLFTTRHDSAATGNSNYGWFGGGSTSPFPSPKVATVDRIDFSNDSTTASSRSSLTSPGRSSLAATSGVLNIRRQKAGNYGWFGGGEFGEVFSRVDRIDFSNDSATAVVRGSLNAPTGIVSLAATGNSNYGWFCGGAILPNTQLSSVDRIDFSNDSVAASVRGPLKQQRRFLAATGNSNYGWFGGGQNSPSDRGAPHYSIVDRIDFSNDSAGASVRGSLSSPERYGLAATGNSNYGWFCGGAFFNSKSATGININDRIDFSNDFVAASPRGQMIVARQSFAATGNSNYGWFGGGASTPGAIASVERMDFSNDSTSTSPRGALSQTIYVLAATGNSNYGWFGGGNIGPTNLSGTRISNVYRINFSNDSVTTVERGGLSTERERLAATSNATR
jgi:hypothetical protein